MTSTNKLHAVDYVVFAISLAASTGIGIFFACTGGKQKSMSEFLLANRRMQIFPVALSMMATMLSSVMMLGVPAEVYSFGTLYFWTNLALVLSISLSAHVYIPVFFELKLTSVYEYLELRFHRVLRVACAMLFSVQTIIYMSIVLYGPALALNAVSGLNVWISVVVVGGVCTVYTAVGGLKAVIWTDVFQTLIMIGGLITVLVLGSNAVGGFQRVIELNEMSGRMDFYNTTIVFDPDPTVRHSFWTLVLAFACLFSALTTVNQSFVQRAISVPSLRDAQLAYWIATPFIMGLTLITIFVGLVIYGYYHDCDPYSSGQVTSNDQLLPLLVVDVLGFLHGIPGLFLACLVSATLSTVSSSLNALATVALLDIIKVFRKNDISDENGAKLSKIIATSYGMLCIGVSAIFVAVRIGSIIRIFFAIVSVISGPLLGIFNLGMLFPWANSIGAGVGLLLAYVLTFWMTFGAIAYPTPAPRYPVSTDGCPLEYNVTSVTTSVISNLTVTLAPPAALIERPAVAKLYTLSYLWVGVVGWLVVVVVGIVVSFLSGHTKLGNIDPRLLSPLVRRFLPAKFRKTKTTDDDLVGNGTTDVLLENTGVHKTERNV